MQLGPSGCACSLRIPGPPHVDEGGPAPGVARLGHRRPDRVRSMDRVTTPCVVPGRGAWRDPWRATVNLKSSSDNFVTSYNVNSNLPSSLIGWA